MTTSRNDRMGWVSFISYGCISFALILNILWVNIEQPPHFPYWADLKAALIYSISFASSLFQGLTMESSYLLTGIFLIVILPWGILALVFRKNILRILLSLSVYAILLTGISWLLARFNIQPPLPEEGKVLQAVATLINIPFAYLFYLLFLLIGDSLYPLPLFLLSSILIRRFWGGYKSRQINRAIIWGYIELTFLMALISLFSTKVSGGLIANSFAQYLTELSGKWLAVLLFLLSLSAWFYMSFPKLRGGSKPIMKKTKKKSTAESTPPAPKGRLQFNTPKGVPALESIQTIEKQEFPDHSEEAAQTKTILNELIEKLELPLVFDKQQRGPSFLLFLYGLKPGTPLKEIKAKKEEIEFHLNGKRIQCQIPLPGVPRIGFLAELTMKQPVAFSEGAALLRENQNELPIFMGKSLLGEDYLTDLKDHPHLLIGGSTGSGKSQFLHVLLASLFQSNNYNNLRLILMDPKSVEFARYSEDPRLACPILNNLSEIQEAFQQLLEQMEKRYQILHSQECRDIEEYNAKFSGKMPYIIVIVDEASDILIQDSGKIKQQIILLAQKSRAAGIHLILATQRPSSDVIDGLIKSNFPTRLAFKTASATDSRIILDEGGAEKLLGKGDCLFRYQGHMHRLQSAIVLKKDASNSIQED